MTTIPQTHPHLVVGLTGSIGSGKSAVAKMFEEWGATVVDADILAREVVQAGCPAIAEIRKVFGAEAIAPDGSMDRKKVGAVIFSDKGKRKELEKILHPRIREEWLNRLATFLEASERQVIVYVVPLLFESGIDYSEMQKTIVVSAPDDVCLARITARDHITLEEAKKRLSAQMPTSEKEKLADIVIRNDGDLDTLRARAEEVFRSLTT